MNRILIIIIVLLSSWSANSQDSLNTHWLLSFNLGIQADDRRLFEFPPKQHLLDNQPDITGTYQVGIIISMKIVGKSKLKLFGGLGLSVELSTFLRPFDHMYGNKPGPLILTYTDRYYKYLVQSPVLLNYKLSNRLGLSMDILPQFDFRTDARWTDEISYNYIHSWNIFDFYSVELNPGLIYFSKLFDFGLNYRAFQFKKIDKIIFNYNLRDPRTDQTFETYNPFKIWLSFGYHF